MKTTAILLSTKMAARLSRLFGRGGGQALPGLIAEKLDPHLAGTLARGLKHGVILVTGTNGKTTTTKLIAAMLTANGEHVLTNQTGSNLKRGITSSLITGTSVTGKLPYTVGLFEVDEASLRRVAPDLMPKQIVVLNLFRDQLDRYGELDTTAALIGEGIASTDAELYLNADDPLVANLAKYASDPTRVNFFGIEGLPVSGAHGHTTVADSDRCPNCKSKLTFDRVFYGHIGHYRCPNGDFARPRPIVAITNVAKADIHGSHFTVAISGKRSDMVFPLPGTYNLYNALATLSLAHGLGIATPLSATTLAHTEAAFGRVEKVNIWGREIYLLLIKNPAGFSQVIETFLAQGANKHILMAINDLAADGRDVSWLWDVKIETLTSTKPVIVTTGTRGLDMSLRLHYAGIEAENRSDLSVALETFINSIPSGATAYVLPTYTALIQIRKLMSKLTHMNKI
jgi:UDP-N-acetylmuramyl tripeptide synthase